MKRFILMVFMLFCPLPSALFENSIAIRQGYMSTIQGDTTVVSGLMIENTTWTLEGSPYVISEDVIVDLDVFLTIEAGVTVKFTNGTNLIVDGHLIAQGNSTHEIIFTSNSTTPSQGDWGTINIREYSSPTSFEYIKVEYASTALIIAVPCNITNSLFQHNNGNAISLQDAGNVYIENIQVMNNTGTGISGSGQNITIENVQVLKNGAGMEISGNLSIYLRNITVVGNAGFGLNTKSGSAKVYDANISANSGSGILNIGPASGKLDVFNSSVTHNGVGLFVNYASVTVEDSIFFNNTNGLSTGWYSSLTIKRCNIFGNRNHGIAQSERSGLRVHNSSIRDNEIDGIHGAGYSRIHNTNISNNENGIASYGGGFICNSFIQNNSGSGVWSQGMVESFSMDRSVVRHNQYGVRVNEEEFWVSRSKIVDNVVGVYSNPGALSFYASSSTIANNSLANVDARSLRMEYCEVYSSLMGIQLDSGQINFCNIHNHTDYNIENEGSNDVNATYNWWGTTNETSIEESIYDFYDNFTLGRVFYTPYLMAPMEIDTTAPSMENVSQHPEDNIQPEDTVKINATIIDKESGVGRVTLNYTYTNSSRSWKRIVEMTNLEGNVWNATIPPFPADTNVTYIIVAEDNFGNVITTEELGYKLEYPVIPELPSLLILPIFIIVTMLAATILRKSRAPMA